MIKSVACFIALSLFVFCVGCNSDAVVDDGVVDFDKDDATMNAAMDQARATFGQFEENWQREEVGVVSLKFKMETSAGEYEYIWFEPSEITASSVTGTCSNDPRDIPGLAFGDERTVDRSKVADWMIMENGKCYGGYTIRVMSERDPDNAPPLEFADYPASQ